MAGTGETKLPVSGIRQKRGEAVMRKDKRKRNEGVTLVEMIVVIVIVGILAAIVLPSLFKYINRAKSRQAELDLRSAATALTSAYIELYANYEIKQGQIVYSQRIGWGREEVDANYKTVLERYMEPEMFDKITAIFISCTDRLHPVITFNYQLDKKTLYNYKYDMGKEQVEWGIIPEETAPPS